MQTGKLRPDREVTAPRQFDKVSLDYPFLVHLDTVWKWWWKRMHALTLGCEAALWTLYIWLCFM